MHTAFIDRAACTSTQKILISIYQNLGKTCKYIFRDKYADGKTIQVIILVHCFSFETKGSNGHVT